MTHVSHPYGFRLGITKDWHTNWFAKSPVKYRALVREDFLLRQFLEKELVDKMVSNVRFERDSKSLVIFIRTGRPGFIIGREGTGVDVLTKKIKHFMKKQKLDVGLKVSIRIEEVRYHEQEAALIAESVSEMLKKRMPYRRVIKQTIDKVMANHEVKGARIVLSGRLGGVEIARREQVKRGSIPLQTIRADIDYTHKGAILPYGTIGIKVWIYKGEIDQKDNKR